jgi:hypothetical protein
VVEGFIVEGLIFGSVVIKISEMGQESWMG